MKKALSIFKIGLLLTLPVFGEGWDGTSLRQLSDTDASVDPSDNDLIIYNDTTELWTPETLDADEISTDTTNFDGALSPTEDTIQLALDVLDDAVAANAPKDATYITQTVNATLTAEQALTSLTDGIVKVNGTTGVLSTATADTDYDSSVTNEINTITTPDTNVTAGLAITFADEGSIAITEAADTITFTVTETDPNALLTAGTDNVNDTHLDTGTGANQISAADLPIADAGSIITATEVEGALQENRTAIDLNTLKDTNVSTTLSLGTVGATTVAITSDGGADDVTLPAATTTDAGLLTAALFDEIDANTAKVTDDDVGVAEVYDATGWDADTSSPQKNDVRDKIETMDTAIGLNTAKATNVSTDLSAGTRTATTIDVNSSDGSNATLVEADTTNAGILGAAKWDEIVANTSKTTESTTVTTPLTLDGISVGMVNRGDNWRDCLGEGVCHSRL